MKTMTEAFISDIHFGTYDQDLVAWELCLETLRIDPVDLIFLGGDIFDFLNISRYLKDPTYNITFQEEIDAGEYQLERLRKVAPNSRIWLLPGNHDTPRLQKAIWSKIPELAGLRALRYENLIDFKSLDIECFPEGKPIKIGHLWHIHGHEVLRNARVNPAKAVLDVMQGNTIFGHVHKFTTYQNWDVNGFQYAAWSNGCLASLTPHYALKPDWCQGYTRVYYTPGGYFNVVPMQFFHNPDDPQHRGVVMNGTLYRTESIEGIGQIVADSQPNPWNKYTPFDVVSGPRVGQHAKLFRVGGGTQWADASKMPYAHEEPDTKPDIPQVTMWDESSEPDWEAMSAIFTDVRSDLDVAIDALFEPGDGKLWNQEIRDALNTYWKRVHGDYLPYDIRHVTGVLVKKGYPRCKSGSLRGIRGLQLKQNC